MEAAQAPPTPTFDPFNNIMAELNSCSAMGFDCSHGPAPPALSPAALDNDALAHLPDLHAEQQNPYPTSKGLPSSFQFFSQKLAVPETSAMDIPGFSDMFIPSAQSFRF